MTTSTQPHFTLPMNNLDMLTSREQLMEDIDSIIESNFGLVDYKAEVIEQLCDAVLKNFPSTPK